MSEGGTEGPGAERREAPPASGLPCLLSNNSDKKTVQTTREPAEVIAKINVLTGGHKRSAFVLATEIMGLANDFGLKRLGFLTLTFSDRVQDLKEANRRFNNLNRRVLKARYRRAVVVTERQQSGRVHFHLLVVLGADIRSGVDFAAIARRDYRSANPALRAEWAFWRKTARLYCERRRYLIQSVRSAKTNPQRIIHDTHPPKIIPGIAMSSGKLSNPPCLSRNSAATIGRTT